MIPIVRHICPWHSWIARETPTLKVTGSNPAGQAIKEKVTIGGFFFYRLIVRVAPHVTARKSIAFSCEDAAKPNPCQVSNPAGQAKNSTSFDLSNFLSKPQAWYIITTQS